MFNPVEAWHVEHDYFARLLMLLKKQVDQFHLGGEPNFALMLDIIAYLREFSDERHHPREDVAFKRMAPHCPELHLTLARLHQEHRVIASAGERLRKDLEAVLAGHIVPLSEIETAAATYEVYYGNHIALEEEAVLPRAATVLMPADWEIIRDAVPHGHTPMAGSEGDERFRELRRQIALEA